MTESISKYQKRQGQIIKLDVRNRKQFLTELEEGEEFIEILQRKQKLRTYLQNKYLHGGVLSEAVPELFSTLNEAKDYFTELFLSKETVYDEGDEIEMQKDLSTARKILKFEYRNIYHGNIFFSKRLIVKWVQSTATLSTSELNEFINLITVNLSTKHNIQVKTPEEYYAQ